MAAFREALDAGADGIELDVQLTRDGVPIVLHDTTLDRTTDGRGAVRSLSLRQVRRCDAGSWFDPSFSGELVPTLEEVLCWAGTRLRLNLEIKDAAAAGAVLDLQRKYPDVDTLLSSFNRRLLFRIRQTEAHQPLAVLVDQRLWRFALSDARRLAAEGFNPHADLYGPSMAAACRRYELKVFPWTVDDPARARQLRRLGASGLFSNTPAAMRCALDKGSSMFQTCPTELL